MDFWWQRLHVASSQLPALGGSHAVTDSQLGTQGHCQRCLNLLTTITGYHSKCTCECQGVFIYESSSSFSNTVFNTDKFYDTRCCKKVDSPIYVLKYLRTKYLSSYVTCK